MTPSLCLELTGNVSDTGFLLNRNEETDFNARLDGNQGFMMIPTPLGSDADCLPLDPDPGRPDLGLLPSPGMNQ